MLRALTAHPSETLQFTASVNSDEGKFFSAVLKSDIQTVQNYILAGKNVNATVLEFGGNALHVLAGKKFNQADDSIAQILINAGTNHLALTKSKLSPLEVAVACDNTPILSTLLKLKNDRLNAAFLMAVFKNAREHIKLLHDAGADHTCVDEDSNSALHICANSNAQKDIFSWLLTLPNIKVNAKNNWGLTPLHRAAMCGSHEIVEVLLTQRPDVDIQDNDQNTALHFAAQNCSDTIIAMLMQAGAKSLKNRWGYTPIDCAQAWNWKIIKIYNWITKGKYQNKASLCIDHIAQLDFYLL